MKTPAKIALTLSLMIPFIAGGTPSQAAERVSTLSPNAATQSEFSQAQLDAMLAPIALYPDTVLSHVLIASTYPLEIVEADRWARNHPNLKGDDAVAAVDNQDWDPSVKALVAFPDILQRMSEDLDWTQRLGDAFLADEERVMDSIQTLRNRAYDSGNLDKVDHVRVVREEKVIVIEPSVERVVYVPAYDTRVVYGNWWWPDYPPVYWHYPSSYVFVSGFYWGPRVYIGPRFYFSACHWHDRRVVVVDHYHSHPRFYDSRSIVRYEGARHWNHDPVHRRGVAYYDDRIRTRYNSPRESYRDSHEYRDRVRNPNIAPNQARDYRQQENRTAGGMHNSLRDNQQNQTRADDLRTRMNERAQGNNMPTERSTNRIDRLNDTDRTSRGNSTLPNRSVDRNTNTDSDRTRGNTRGVEESHTTIERFPTTETKPEQRLYGSDRIDKKDREPSRVERRESQPVERAAPRIERSEPQRIERSEPRVERIAPRVERSESQRMERSESFTRSRDESRGSTSESRGSTRESGGGRTIERGGRER